MYTSDPDGFLRRMRPYGHTVVYVAHRFLITVNNCILPMYGIQQQIKVVTAL